MKTIPSITAWLMLQAMAVLQLGCATAPDHPAAVASGPLFAADMPAAQMTAQRQRIGQVRAAEEARFAAAESACYQRFAVNDCLTTVQRERRAVREGLRRQEIALNDIERQQRAAEHLRNRAGPDGKLPPLPTVQPAVLPATAPAAVGPATAAP